MPYNQLLSSMTPEISVVVPMRNESPNVERLYRDVTASLSQFGRPYEIVAVDDGSRDDTFELLARLQATDPRVRVIRFRRNFGQTAAFAAGFHHARGRYIVTMDGDNQNDPADIPGMVLMSEQQDLDIVCGWRKDRKDAFVNRRLPSMIANAIISRATGVRLHDYGCSLKVFRSEVVKSMKLYGEMHRFLPAIAAEFGVEIGEKVINHRPREHGKSNYGITRTFRVILDLMTVKFLSSYKTRPLQMFGSVGFVLGGIGALMCAWVTYQRFFGFQSANRPLLIVGCMMGLVGMMLITNGLIAEMLARTYHESQDKPTYVIREIRESQAERSRERVGA
jgi:glycosyltransferase involved in cell wall biosynthesis